MAYFCPNIFIRTATCHHGTDTYLYQQEYFDTILNRAFKQRRETGPDSFDQITAQYTPAATSPRKSPPEHNSDDDSTDADLADKQLKVAVVEKEGTAWNSLFYRTLLGLLASVTTSSITNKTVTTFLSLPVLHKNFVKTCFSKGLTYVLEVQNIRRKYNTAMKRLSRVEFYYIPQTPIPLSLVMLIKIKNAFWSTENPKDELVASLSITCFTQIASKEAFDIENVSEKVTEDEEMHQLEQYCTKIEITIHKNYKVNNKWQLCTTITSFLMFLYNLANWKDDQPRPILCEFLEKILFHLTSEAGKTWLRTHCNVKQLLLVIISQIQKVVVCFVLTGSDKTNHLPDDKPNATTTFTAGGAYDLAQADRLMQYFEADIIKAIDQQKLNGVFDEFTPLFKKEFLDNVPSASAKPSSQQRGAVSPQKLAKAVAAKAKATTAATAAARSDTTRNDRRQPPANNQYGPRFPSNYHGNQQNHYDRNQKHRPAPDKRFKNCGVLKNNGERLPWLKCQQNPNGSEHPPLVSVLGNPPCHICMIGSTCGMVCRRPNCTNIHLVQAADITDGMVTFNKYIRDFEKLDWINAAAKALAAAARPGPLDQGR